MASTAPTTSGLAFHASIVAFCENLSSDETIDMLVETGDIALDEALAAPANGFEDLRAKLAALMTEASDVGVVEVDDLAFIARDLDLLIGRIQ